MATKLTYSLLYNDEEQPHHNESAPGIISEKNEFSGAPKSEGFGDQAGRNIATRFSSYINLTNTIVGAGMLGLPYAYANTGWVLGSVLLVVSGILTIFSLHLLSHCAARTKYPSSFYTVTNATIPRFTFLIDFAVLLQCFGVGISYLIVIGGLMPQVMDHLGASGIWNSRLTWVIIGFIIVTPLSCLKNLDALRFTSLFAFACVLFMTCLIIAYSAPSSGLEPCLGFEPDEAGDVCVGSTANAVASLDVLRVTPIFVFAYSCQQNIFPIVNEMKTPTQSRVDSVAFAAIGTAGTVYAAVAIAGYGTYGNSVSSNILINYPNTDLTSTARIFVCFLVAFSYPLMAHPGRASALALWKVVDLYFVKPVEGLIEENKAEVYLTETVQNIRYVVITAFFLLGSFAIAMVLDDLGVMLSLVGATGATIVSFILPGISYYVMHRDDPPSFFKYGALAMFIFGLIFMPLSVIFIFV